jgi:trimeric autotransporter adhesin
VTCSNMQATPASNNASCGMANGTATVNVSGGNQPYSYHWSSGQTTASINGLSGGSYIVTITDFYGCSQTANATVNIITPPS